MNNIPRLLIGPPGVGKTEWTLSQADHVEVLLLSTLTEEDIAGLPYHTDGTEYRTEPPFFRHLREADTKGRTTVLFLDEMDKARREVADTLLTLVASRKVGEWSLPPLTRIIAAANPPEWGGGDGISQAMMSRFCATEFVPSVKNWCNWATERFPWASALIDNIRTGEVPLMETTGDGLGFRLTCPRTLALCLTAWPVTAEDERPVLCAGLLTPNTASAVMRLLPGGEPDDSPQLLARSVVRRSPHGKVSVPFRVPS